MQQIKRSAIAIATLMLIIIAQAPIQAQVSGFTKPSWWFGIAAGANFNNYTGATQKLTTSLRAPAAFNKGKGAGLFVVPLMEYHRPDSYWGFMLQAGYDSREGKFDQTKSTAACNCTTDLTGNLSYFTVEPSLRFAPLNSGLYLYAGPRLAFNWSNSFVYKQGKDASFPDQAVPAEVKGNFSDMNKVLLSMQVGVGYDIRLSSASSTSQVLLSPFVAYHPSFGQSPRSVDSWDLSSWRVGAALKFGRGYLTIIPAPVEGPMPVMEPAVAVRFTINAPKNIPGERRMRETFPILNYVFFDLGSTAIPEAYVLLQRSQVKDFKEDQLEVFKPKRLSGRSNRQMEAYYNVLNILGDRMGKNPETSINLVGSSESGTEDATAMAESVKRYLVNIFDINVARITTEGRDKPKLPSEKLGATLDLKLLKEGDRRVSIESSSPALLMQFQSGPYAPLMPVELVETQEAPLDSYVTFTVEGARKELQSWSLEVKDEKGKVQNLGPFYNEKVSMPGKMLLGSRLQGDYTVTMLGKTNSGQIVKQMASMHTTLWTPDKNEEGTRFTVIFGFDESKAISIYEKYLTDIVAPKIPKGATVVIHGYTDIIGDTDYNQNLSLNRAMEVKRIIESTLSKSGKTDVKMEVYAFGEDEILSPFNNNFPEERFYNRTVIIDILPAK